MLHLVGFLLKEGYEFLELQVYKTFNKTL